MFERFTDRARRVVVYAQDEAKTLEHNYIGTEHLLLGLLREEEGIAAQALASFSVTVDAVREHVVRETSRGNGTSVGHIPFTPRAKKPWNWRSEKRCNWDITTSELSIFCSGYYVSKKD